MWENMHLERNEDKTCNLSPAGDEVLLSVLTFANPRIFGLSLFLFIPAYKWKFFSQLISLETLCQMYPIISNSCY